MTIIKGRLRPEGTNNYADVVHLETSADQIVETTAKKVMTAAERTKLNGIAAGAQVNPTASQILASLKTVDGAGSGLDADTLDGKQASDFAKVVSGSYTGDGVTGREIVVGFRPKLVIIQRAPNYSNQWILVDGYEQSVEHSSDGHGTSNVDIITDNGFKVGKANNSSTGYIYMAIS